MKKITFVLMLAIAMVACEGKMGPMGPRGEDGRDGTANWTTIECIIKEQDWQRVGEGNQLNSHFFADVEIPELTNDIFKSKSVIGYISVGKNVKNGLPFVVHKGGVVEENGVSKEYLWTQTYDFDFEPGWARFYVTYSDFITEENPEDLTFYVVLMW